MNRQKRSWKKTADISISEEQYRGIGLDEPVPYAEAVTMYRVITGACKAGTQAFIDRQRELKEAYTPREIMEMTSGEYGGEAFRRFFEEGNNEAH